MKKSLICLFLMTLALVSRAEEQTSTLLVLTFNDETTAVYNLATQPVITFSDSLMVLTSPEATASYVRSEVKEFHFEIGYTYGIHSQSSALNFRYTDGRHIEVSGAAAANVALFDLNGKLVSRGVSENGVVRMDLQNLPAGSYVVRTANQNIKILKK